MDRTQARLFLDECVHGDAMDGLRRRGYDAIDVREARRQSEGDVDQLEYATLNGRILVTHDSDFLDIHEEWQRIGREHAGILYCNSQPPLSPFLAMLDATIKRYSIEDIRNYWQYITP